MPRRIYVLSFFILFLCSCGPGPFGPGMLKHSVHFDLKPNITEAERQQFIVELERLAGIEHLSSFYVSTRANSTDPRQNASFDVSIHMTFASMADLANYQQDLLHLEVKKNIGGNLTGSPVVYDAFIQ